jgi:hypothetical protein
MAGPGVSMAAPTIYMDVSTRNGLINNQILSPPKKT